MCTLIFLNHLQKKNIYIWQSYIMLNLSNAIREYHEGFILLTCVILEWFLLWETTIHLTIINGKVWKTLYYVRSATRINSNFVTTILQWCAVCTINLTMNANEDSVCFQGWCNFQDIKAIPFELLLLGVWPLMELFCNNDGLWHQIW